MIKILQFTDLHLRQALPGHNGHIERRSRQIPALLSRMAARIAAEAPDLVVVSGDLLDAPHALLEDDPEIDLAAYAAAAERDYRMVLGWLEGLGRPWIAVPGNHDHPASFDAVFGATPRSLTLGPLTVHAFHDWEQTGNQALRLGEERRRFEATLDAATADTLMLHVQHYLIRPFVDYGYPLLYGDADALAARLAEAPGRHLALAGHWHGGTPLVEAGRARFAGCPAFCEPPHPYRVFTLDAGGGLEWHEAALGRLEAEGPVVVLDRTGLLTRPPIPGAAPGFSLREDAAAVMAALEEAGATVAIASAWDDPECRDAGWREALKRHDELFAGLAAMAPVGATLALCLAPESRAGRRLPAEAIACFADLLPRLERLFGVAAAEMLFLSADPARRALARAAGATVPCLPPGTPPLAAIREAVGL